jgi:hypothetical protein
LGVSIDGKTHILGVDCKGSKIGGKGKGGEAQPENYPYTIIKKPPQNRGGFKLLIEKYISE